MQWCVCVLMLAFRAGAVGSGVRGGAREEGCNQCFFSAVVWGPGMVSARCTAGELLVPLVLRYRACTKGAGGRWCLRAVRGASGPQELLVTQDVFVVGAQWISDVQHGSLRCVGELSILPTSCARRPNIYGVPSGPVPAHVCTCNLRYLRLVVSGAQASNAMRLTEKACGTLLIERANVSFYSDGSRRGGGARRLYGIRESTEVWSIRIGTSLVLRHAQRNSRSDVRSVTSCSLSRSC
jgi:hypothetical protein